MSGPPATAVRVFETPLGRIGVVATARGLARVMLPNQVAQRLAPREYTGGDARSAFIAMPPRVYSPGAKGFTRG